MLELKLHTEFHELRKAFDCDVKYVVISSGRRTGKTYEAFQWLFKDLLTNNAITALWVDTKHSNIDKYVERYCYPILQSIKNRVLWNQQKKILMLPNAAYIDFGSAERAENLEGFQYDRVIINEAGHALKRSSLWNNTLQPMTKGDTNKTRIIGTPQGRNEFFKLFQRGQTGEKEYKSYHFTAFDSPYWDPTELEKIKKQVPADSWKQNYLAEFIEGAGPVFRNVTECIGTREDETAKEGVKYAMGVDLAKHEDFTVIVIADKKTKEVVFMDRFNQIDWTFQKKRIINTWEKFERPELVIDSTGVGDAIYDDLVRAGLRVEGYKFTSSSKKDLVENLSVAIDNQEIKYPNYPELIAELELYEKQKSKAGNISYNAPSGYHDDIVIALGLVNHLIKTKREIYISML